MLREQKSPRSPRQERLNRTIVEFQQSSYRTSLEKLNDSARLKVPSPTRQPRQKNSLMRITKCVEIRNNQVVMSKRKTSLSLAEAKKNIFRYIVDDVLRPAKKIQVEEEEFSVPIPRWQRVMMMLDKSGSGTSSKRAAIIMKMPSFKESFEPGDIFIPASRDEMADSLIESS